MPDTLSQVPASHQDLLGAALTVGLTTVDGKGRPQATAVWFLVDDDGQLMTSITTDRQKYKNLVRNPNCSLLVIDPENPQRTLEVRAEAELVPDPDKASVVRFARKYGTDPERLLSEEKDRITVVYHPYRIVANPPA